MSSETPWFVRYGKGWTTSIRPRAPQGWLMTAAYVVAVSLLANTAKHGDHWLPWTALIVALTAIYLVAIWRLSEPCKP